MAVDRGHLPTPRHQIFKQEKLTYAARLSLLRHLLPEPAAEDAGSEAPSRQRAEALLEQAVHFDILPTLTLI